MPSQAELQEQALCNAARLGDFDQVRELVEVGRVSVNCYDYIGWPALIVAVVGTSLRIVRFLLEKGAKVDSVAEQVGWTGLAHSVSDGSDVHVAEVLLEYGANIEFPIKQDEGFYSPLGLAMEQNDVDMVALLLRFGANTEQTLYSDDRTQSAMYIACRNWNLGWDGGDGRTREILRLLIEHDDGVDINSFVRVHGKLMTPLCSACRENNMEIAQFLIEQHGARVVFPGRYPDGPCPLVHAVNRGSLQLVRYLVDRLPEQVEDTRLLSSPLETALRSGKLKVAQLLLARGADINDKPFLYHFSKRGQLEHVRFLLQNGANVNMADKNSSGQTPLWIAAKNGHVELVKELLRAGADVTVRDDRVRGETPLGVAYRQGHKGVVFLLLRTSPHVWPRLAAAF